MVRLFTKIVYVKVYENRFVVKLIEGGEKPMTPMTLMGHEAFSTKRLLIGQYSVAEKLLKDGICKLLSARWFSPSPIIVMHPIDKFDGALSEVEERVINEIAVGAGARKVVVWHGHELNDDEVLDKAIAK